MGFFSWITSDTQRSISNAYSPRGALQCYLVTPNNDYLYEGHYEGYGEFAGKDAYTLLAEWNKPELCTGNADKDRIIGIDLFFSSEEIKYPLKFVEHIDNLEYHQIAASKSCPDQGYFYSESDEFINEEWFEEDDE